MRRVLAILVWWDWWLPNARGYSLLTSIPVLWCPKLSLARQVFQQVSFMRWLFWSNHQLTEPHSTVCPVGCMRKKVSLVLSPKLIKLTMLTFRASALSSDEGLTLPIRLRRLFDIMALVVRLFEKILYPRRAQFMFTITWLERFYQRGQERFSQSPWTGLFKAGLR